MNRAVRRRSNPILAAGALLARVTIAAYRILISPLLLVLIGPACRFEPTCSAYAAEAFAVHGPIRGFPLAMRRLARCRPGGGFGIDPVPTGEAASVEVPGKI